MEDSGSTNESISLSGFLKRRLEMSRNGRWVWLGGENDTDRLAMLWTRQQFEDMIREAEFARTYLRRSLDSERASPARGADICFRSLAFCPTRDAGSD